MGAVERLDATMEVSAFVNYRRDDSAAEAKLIADALRRVLPSNAVFMDTEAIPPGETWPDRIRAALAASVYVFVVIGPKWLTASMNEWGQRRIDSESDWVRLEIAGALSDTRKMVVPILVRGAKMPPGDALPSNIAAVTAKQAIEIRHDYWDHDVELVVSRVRAAEARVVPANSLVAPIWPDLSPDLQDAFALAAMGARRQGKKVISTRTLFAALRKLHPEPLREFFDHVPKEALPQALPMTLPIDVGALADIELFSGCVQDSLDHLTSRTNLTRRLSAEDVFVDIARHGTGDSVRRLRTHGVSVGRVNEIVRQLGWRIIERSS